jgi:hypothetical protein
MEPPHTNKYQIIVDIEEGQSEAPTTLEHASEEGWFDISITSDYDEAQTLHMLMAAYMDVAEDFFAKYAQDPAFSPPQFAAMHRRIRTLVAEILNEPTTMRDDNDKPPRKR